jgi:hypothetical protein
MPTGVIFDCICVLAGGFLGCFFGKALPPKIREELNIFLGICSIAIGINSVIKVSAMAPVVFSVLIGYVIGAALKLEDKLTALMGSVLRHLPIPKSRDFSMEQYITVVVLFCASGFGIYGTLVESMSGNSSVLMSKAILDSMTALIFAISLQYAVLIVPIPMAAVMLAIFGLGKVIAPVVSTEMLMDFTACGGILTIAAGLRVAKIKNTAITNLIPALILVMPMSRLWSLLPIS